MTPPRSIMRVQPTHCTLFRLVQQMLNQVIPMKIGYHYLCSLISAKKGYHYLRSLISAKKHSTSSKLERHLSFEESRDLFAVKRVEVEIHQFLGYLDPDVPTEFLPELPHGQLFLQAGFQLRNITNACVQGGKGGFRAAVKSMKAQGEIGSEGDNILYKCRTRSCACQQRATHNTRSAATSGSAPALTTINATSITKHVSHLRRRRQLGKPLGIAPQILVVSEHLHEERLADRAPEQDVRRQQRICSRFRQGVVG